MKKRTIKTPGVAMKAKYKVTTDFGFRDEGEILDCYVLNVDPDFDNALVYHKPNRKKMECGSFEICKLDKNGNYISLSEKHYVNEGDKCKGFHKFLQSLK